MLNVVTLDAVFADGMAVLAAERVTALRHNESLLHL